MTPEIVAKLNDHIRQGLTREADVVYFLVQMGKIIERDDRQSAYPILQFYRNWVTHPKLERLNSNPAMKDILDKLETAAVLFEQQVDNAKILTAVSDTISLRKLWEDVAAFCGDYGVTALLNDAVLMRASALLISILTDLPLVPPPGAYKLVKEFRFAPPTGRNHVARIRIELVNGQFMDGAVVITR